MFQLVELTNSDSGRNLFMVCGCFNSLKQAEASLKSHLKQALDFYGGEIRTEVDENGQSWSSVLVNDEWVMSACVSEINVEDMEDESCE